MKADYDIILDLATNSSPTITEQLITVIENQLKGTYKHCVTVLSTDKIDSVFPGSRSIVSNEPIDLLYKAKFLLDSANVTDFLIVTTLIMKKYWENLCLHMFSAVHNWSVLGVDVTGEVVSFDLSRELLVETHFKEYLKKLGNIEEVKILRSHVIPEKMFNAGFHERHGGVTQLPPLASMNMLYTIRKPDPILVIKENRRRLAVKAGFDPDSMHFAKVEHGANIWVIGKEPPARFDGLATNIPGVTLAAPGADCSMILLADVKTGACGAVHSGWRGTTLGAVRSLLKTMVDEFGTDPKDVRAAIGPTIEASCFTLLAADANPITDLDPSLVYPMKNKSNVVHVDLVGANVIMLEKDGVPHNNIDTSHAVCTVCNKQFYSYQRDSVPFGNQIGFISCRKQPSENI
ncbi:unnamed protein product [Candidula unifasciata]|uniref:Laccase domain-containing protein n=1 Tax=Candidula unifasciata TaxID=100452 RepID=A0A8S3ZAI5_9EUPU|nr:unnamed protein product [Candidula unifasciata]